MTTGHVQQRAGVVFPQQQVGRTTLFTGLRVEQFVVGRAVEHLQVIHQLLTTAAIFQIQGMHHAGGHVSIVEQLGDQVGAALCFFSSSAFCSCFSISLMISRVRV